MNHCTGTVILIDKDEVTRRLLLHYYNELCVCDHGGWEHSIRVCIISVEEHPKLLRAL
jgi:hypothetical protein